MLVNFNGLKRMLLHVTITHSAGDCPLYDRDRILPVVAALKKRDDLAEKHGITLYWMVSGAPEHISFALLESDHIDKVTQFLHEVFITPSSFKVTPVQAMKDIIPVWSQ
jgi:hypothetical protein